MKKVFAIMISLFVFLGVVQATPLDGSEQRLADETREARMQAARECLKARARVFEFIKLDARNMFLSLLGAVPCCVDPKNPQCMPALTPRNPTNGQFEPECLGC